MLRNLFVYLTVMMLCASSVFAAPKRQIIETDVVVVGSGLAGLSAAAVASENGLKVYLIEKMPTLGGAAPFVEGTFAVESYMQRQSSDRITTDQAWNMAMEFSHWKANGAVLRALINRSAENVDWMKARGVVFEKVHTVIYNGPKTWHLFHEGSGATAVKTLVDIIHKTGNKTMTETAGKKLITDSKGNVVGIIAEDTDSGDEIEFHTKGGVILCTGGFANNLKMMKKYIANAEQLVAGPKAGREGDGINMALAVGAGTESMGSLLVLGGIPIGEDPNKTLTDTTPLGQITSVLRQPLLWVSKAGDRFFNEQHSSDWTVSQNAIERVGKRYFVVMDQNTVDELKTKGTFMPYSDWVPAGTKLNLIDQGIKEGEKKGYAFKANTIDALAQKMGVPAGNLKKTVADINRYTEYNYDEVFGKDRRFLRKVEQGPFYAVEGEPSFMSTIGGVRINANMQAVTDQDKPINGLYAAGIDAGGMFGDTYDLIMPGSLSSYAATGGRIASEHIAVKLGKIKK